MDSAVRKPTGNDSLETDEPIRLGGSILGSQRHICAFFSSLDDQYHVLLPFIRDGLERGEKAVHIIDPRHREEHIRQLESIGIDARAMQQTGQLDLREWADAHLRDGAFDPDRTTKRAPTLCPP